MKKVKLLIVYLMAICVCGCSHSFKENFSHIDNEKDAIIATFGEYNSTKGTGVVLINEKEHEKDRTYIYYIVRPPALENYKKALKAESSTKKQEQIVNEMYNKVEQEASEEVIKKIDKLIFSYYTKEEINNLKRGWREMDLPSYITRILVQSIQAYHRREYALTVSALTTLWEGIIQDKVNDKSYRISKRTRENLAKLIEENEFDKIISSFCEEFIFYICKKPEDVKPDVPGRHGIAHCWYEAYPSRKVALNAILFTDFLLKLRPLENINKKSYLIL